MLPSNPNICPHPQYLPPIPNICLHPKNLPSSRIFTPLPITIGTPQGGASLILKMPLDIRIITKEK